MATPADAKFIARIYNHYVRETIITFEEEEVTTDEMRARIAAVLGKGMPWLAAEREGRVVGYAYGGTWKERSAYRFASEIAVYLEPGQTGRGIGSNLFARLMPALKDAGIHAVIGGIALPNEASVALHEKFGLEKVAHFKEVGYKFGKWIDVGYWQRTLGAST